VGCGEITVGVGGTEDEPPPLLGGLGVGGTEDEPPPLLGGLGVDEIGLFEVTVLVSEPVLGDLGHKL
jgi:hypothetical protein